MKGCACIRVLYLLPSHKRNLVNQNKLREVFITCRIILCFAFLRNVLLERRIQNIYFTRHFSFVVPRRAYQDAKHTRWGTVSIKAVTRHGNKGTMHNKWGIQRLWDRLFPFAFLSGDIKLRCVAMVTSSDVFKWRPSVRTTASRSALGTETIELNFLYREQDMWPGHSPVTYLCLVRLITLVKSTLSFVDGFT